jgi:hypothetical protein
VFNGEVFLGLGKFDVASRKRPVMSFDAWIKRAIGQLDTFGGAFTVMSRPLQRVSHSANPVSPFPTSKKNRENRSGCKLRNVFGDSRYPLARAPFGPPQRAANEVRHGG